MYCWDLLVCCTSLSLLCLFNIQGREPYLIDFVKKKKKKKKKKNQTNFTIGLYSDITLQTDFFQTWYRDHQSLHFEISVDDLDLHSRSQLYEI